MSGDPHALLSIPEGRAETMDTPLSRRLRRETADLHARAEAAPRLRRCLSPDYTLAEYIELLGAFYVLHAETERLLLREPCLTLRDMFRSRRRSPLIARDLRGLGGRPRADQGSELTALLPLCETRSERLGAAYVLEGSALGGALIGKALRRSLGAGIADRLLFHAAADGLAGRWRDFLSVLDREAEDAEGAIAAARTTFRAVTIWLERPAYS